jgi:hypothetical protein
LHTSWAGGGGGSEAKTYSGIRETNAAGKMLAG